MARLISTVSTPSAWIWGMRNWYSCSPAVYVQVMVVMLAGASIVSLWGAWAEKLSSTAAAWARVSVPPGSSMPSLPWRIWLVIAHSMAFRA